jgi:hypothetical protein
MVEVYENILPSLIANAAAVAFPDPSWSWWHRYPNGKLASKDPARLPAACRLAIETLAALIPSPTPDSFVDLDLHGAGLHYMPQGTALSVHTDAQQHPWNPWQRTASLVWFASEVTGGSLVVGTETFTPKFNTAIVFDGQIPHCVTQVQKGDRKTLAVFTWRVSNFFGGNTAAVFQEDGKPQPKTLTALLPDTINH